MHVSLRARLALAVAVAVAALAACGGDGAAAVTPPSSTPPSANTLALSYVLRPGVRTLADADVAAITVTASGTTDGTARWSVPSTLQAAPGDVLLAAGVPYRVVTVSGSGATRDLALVRPQLSEVFQQLTASGRVDVTQLSDTDASATAAGRAQALSASGRTLPMAVVGNALTLDIPVQGDGVDGHLTLSIQGSIDVDAEVDLAGLQTAHALFTGSVAVTGSLPVSKGGSAHLAQVQLANPCVPFQAGVIPASVCFPLKFTLDASAQVAAMVPVNFSQRFVGGVAWPDASAMPAAAVTPDATAQVASGFDPTAFLPCTTVSASVTPALKFEPTLMLMRVFDVASLPSSLAFTTTVRARLDPRQSAPTVAVDISSALEAKVDGTVGLWLGMDSAAELGQVSGSPLLGALADALAQGVFTLSVPLLSTSVPILPESPLPACILVAPGAVTAAGEALAVTLDPDSGSGAPPTSWVVTTPSGAPLPASSGITDALQAAGPGTYVIAVTQTDPDGRSTTSEIPYPVVPAGTYAGSFSGDDSGPCVAQVDALGNISVQGQSSRYGNAVTGSGTLASAGDFSVGGSTAGGAVFAGGFTPSDAGWVMSGTWSKAGHGGSFSLAMQH